MTATSIAPYFDLGVIVDAELALTVDGELEVLLELELVDVVEPAEVVFAIDIVVTAVEFPLLVIEAVEVTLALAGEEEPVEVLAVALADEEVELSAKTPPDEEDAMLEVTEDAELPEDETALPLQEPEILMLW
jgi:hypothetical protein